MKLVATVSKRHPPPPQSPAPLLLLSHFSLLVLCQVFCAVCSLTPHFLHVTLFRKVSQGSTEFKFSLNHAIITVAKKKRQVMVLYVELHREEVTVDGWLNIKINSNTGHHCSFSVYWNHLPQSLSNCNTICTVLVFFKCTNYNWPTYIITPLLASSALAIWLFQLC